jgi:hypothetical protein
LTASRGQTAALVSALRRSWAGGRRRALVLGAVAASFVAAMLIVGAIAQFPITVADTAAAWIFGSRGGDNGQPQVPDICATPPSVPAAPSTPPDTDTAAADGDGDRSGSRVAPAPAPGLDDHGRLTPEAMAVYKQIPVGADVSVAEGWMMYRLAHPQDDATSDFAKFAVLYRDTASRLSGQAAALDVVATMDPTANYSPYLLLAQTGSYLLMRQGSVTATDPQRDALIETLGATCAGQTHGDSAAPKSS